MVRPQIDGPSEFNLVFEAVSQVGDLRGLAVVFEFLSRCSAALFTGGRAPQLERVH